MRAAWPEVNLGEICEFKYGKALREHDRSGSGFGVFGSNGEVGRHSFALTQGPTIVVGRKGSFGQVVYSDEPCWPIDTTYYVDETATRADLRWLYYRLRALPLTSLNRAAAVPGLNRSDAYAQRFLLPPIEEQRRIAAILDAADALRAKRRQALAKLESLPRAIFLEMFGDPLLNGRGFPTRSLNEVVDGIFDCPHSTPLWAARGVVCIRTSNLGLGKWDWSDTRYVSEAAFEERSRRAYLEPADIILSREGTVGIAAIVEPGMRLCMGQRLVQIRPGPRTMRSRFLLDLLLFQLAPHRIGQVMRGSTAKHLNVKDLRRMVVITPSTKLQERYATKVNALSSEQGKFEKSGVNFDILAESLRERAFSGEL